MQNPGCTINELVDRFARQYKSNVFHSPASGESIQRARGLLGTAIPGDYAAFLRCANGGELFIPGTVFYGAPMQDVSIDMLLTYHNNTEKRAEAEVPGEWLIIGKTNFGDLICMNDAGTIAQWDMEAGEVFLTWNNLVEYLCYEEDLYVTIEGENHD